MKRKIWVEVKSLLPLTPLIEEILLFSIVKGLLFEFMGAVVSTFGISMFGFSILGTDSGGHKWCT